MTYLIEHKLDVGRGPYLLTKRIIMKLHPKFSFNPRYIESIVFNVTNDTKVPNIKCKILSVKPQI